MPRAPRSPAKYAPYRPFLPVPIASEAPGVTFQGATPLAMTPRTAPVAYPPAAFDRYAYGGGGLPSLPTRGRYGTTSAQLELHGREDARGGGPMRWLRLTVPLMTLFVLSLPTSSDAVPPITESEPNNASAEADALAGGQCFVVGSGAISPAGDGDFWSFPGTAGASAWAFVDPAAGADSLLNLFGPDGTQIEVDNDDGLGNGGGRTAETPPASALGGAAISSGTHSLSVTENGGDAVIDPYRLFLAVPTASPTPEAEPNDAFGQANPISGCPE